MKPDSGPETAQGFTPSGTTGHRTGEWIITDPDLARRMEVRRKERKAARRRRAITRLIALALAFVAGMALGYAIRDGQQEPVQAATTANQAQAQDQDPTVTVLDPAEFVSYAPPMDSLLELWSIEHGQEDAPLLNVDLDPVTQWAIFTTACDRDPAIFCAVMAIGYKESRFQADTIGDGGNSLGMMQINVRSHADRIEALGITDLMDPIQSAIVAVDYMNELMDAFQVGPGDHALYMAYNMGPRGARIRLQAGTTSTAYSREVVALYQSYMEEMEGAK